MLTPTELEASEAAEVQVSENESDHENPEEGHQEEGVEEEEAIENDPEINDVDQEEREEEEAIEEGAEEEEAIENDPEIKEVDQEEQEKEEVIEEGLEEKESEVDEEGGDVNNPLSVPPEWHATHPDQIDTLNLAEADGCWQLDPDQDSQGLIFVPTEKTSIWDEAIDGDKDSKSKMATNKTKMKGSPEKKDRTKQAEEKKHREEEHAVEDLVSDEEKKGDDRGAFKDPANNHGKGSAGYIGGLSMNKSL